jgi:hypothetical protein
MHPVFANPTFLQPTFLTYKIIMLSVRISISIFGKAGSIFTEFVVDVCWGFPTIANNNMEDARTYEVGTVLALSHPLTYTMLHNYFKVTET